MEHLRHVYLSGHSECTRDRYFKEYPAFIDISLQAADRTFTLYQAHSLPFSTRGLRSHKDR
jgi:hypothetical protein